MAPRETENNAYAKFWDDKQRALWYVMVFSGVVDYFVPLETDIWAERQKKSVVLPKYTFQRSNHS